MAELYVGLMSGTSADGINAALVDFSEKTPHLIATYYDRYPHSLREKILNLYQEKPNEIFTFGELDHLLGKKFSEAVIALLKKANVSPHAVIAIGSHGQTIRHVPNYFSLQIADPNIIAAETSITTVADFRRRDIAHGGQGAPLTPAFHHAILSDKKINRAIINIGGISNITVLPSSANSILGFDIGPGNALLDEWINLHQQHHFDKNGAWAAQGNLQLALLDHLLADSYFHLSPPKSTGREYFNLSWLQKKLATFKEEISPVDVQTTLVVLTARLIIMTVKNYFADAEILICGGGAYNAFLMAKLREIASPSFSIKTTAEFGFAPEWVEAVAFAWLAKQTLNRKTGNLPSVTGANKPVILGGIYYAD